MWTEERVALLKRLWADGLSASQIADRIGGITRNAVIGKVTRLGLPGRVVTDRHRATLPAPAREQEVSIKTSQRERTTIITALAAWKGNKAGDHLSVAEIANLCGKLTACDASALMRTKKKGPKRGAESAFLALVPRLTKALKQRRKITELYEEYGQGLDVSYSQFTRYVARHVWRSRS